jgi:hypothetical protein
MIGGTNTLHDGYVTVISQMNISGMQTLQAYVSPLMLKADQLSEFGTIDTSVGKLKERGNSPLP